jgi:hypothetical protein
LSRPTASTCTRDSDGSDVDVTNDNAAKNQLTAAINKTLIGEGMSGRRQGPSASPPCRISASAEFSPHLVMGGSAITIRDVDTIENSSSFHLY